jgi:AcrR family transcriptional regulator
MARKNIPNSVSKEYLLKSLVNLMHEHTYQSITITDITSAAGVSRMAYYRNYAQKDEIISKFILSIAEKVEGYQPEEWLVAFFETLARECFVKDCALGKAIEEASCHQLLADTVALALNRACGEKLRADGVWQSVMIGAFCGAFIDSSKRGSIDDVNDYVQALKKMLLH